MPCSWIRRLNIMKPSILPQIISRFNTNEIKILAGLFLKFIWKRRARTKLRCLRKLEGEFPPKFCALGARLASS